MENEKNFYIIIDFDSTFVKIEALDKLSEIALKQSPKKEQIEIKVKKITEQGMNGKIPFNVSLQRRLRLFTANKKHIDELIKVLKKSVSPSILPTKYFLKNIKKISILFPVALENMFIP